MTHELFILIAATVSLALIHTLAGPDNYLPFIVISRAIFLCGMGMLFLGL
jgi:hypothetical protein